jgi:AraC-like DNA-binding protein
MSDHPPAYAFVRDFDPAPAQVFCVDRHYLLYAAKGAMRLECDGKGWILPPARAALIHAGREITITIPQKLSACSVLYHPDFGSPPDDTLAVFEMTPLARELVLGCRAFGPDDAWTDYAETLFRALSQVTRRLAKSPSPTGLPSPRSDTLRKALDLTELELAGTPNFEKIADAVALTPRTLARRFSDELGMTWRQALRRLRLSRAIEALAGTDKSVTEIGIDVGYTSLSAFNSAFRDFTGQNPTDYRDSFRP